PALGELLRVGPASPAEHGQDHQEECDRIQAWDVHGRSGTQTAPLPASPKKERNRAFYSSPTHYRAGVLGDTPFREARTEDAEPIKAKGRDFSSPTNLQVARSSRKRHLASFQISHRNCGAALI